MTSIVAPGFVSIDKNNLDSAVTGPDSLGHELWIAVSKNRSELQRAGDTRAAQQWLKPQLKSPEGTQKVYGMMEDLVAKQSFLTKLKDAQTGKEADELRSNEGQDGWLDPWTQKAEWWEPPITDSSKEQSEDNSLNGIAGQPAVNHQAEEPLDSYIMVEKEDVLDAIGSFVAAYIAELPQAQNLPPAELQLAITKAFKELRKGRLQQLWGWGRAIYRCVSFSYGAFTVYENPWLVRALLTAMWTASRVMLGLLI